MESEKETISTIDIEFSEEELLEALKKKGGRPSNRTRELRERLQEAQQVTDILGILKSGVLERLIEDNARGFRPSDIRGAFQVDKDPEKVKAPKGFTADLLKRSGLVNDKFLETNKEILALSDDVVSNALTIYAPPIVAIGLGVAGLWIAEGQIKEIPPMLHTIVLNIKLFTPILNGLGLLLTAATAFLNDFVGIIPDIQNEVNEGIKDVQTKAEKSVEDPLGTGQKFVVHEVEKFQKLIERALKGDIFAILELSLHFNPATMAAILAGDFVFGKF